MTRHDRPAPLRSRLPAHPRQPLHQHPAHRAPILHPLRQPQRRRAQRPKHPLVRAAVRVDRAIERRRDDPLELFRWVCRLRQRRGIRGVADLIDRRGHGVGGLLERERVHDAVPLCPQGHGGVALRGHDGGEEAALDEGWGGRGDGRVREELEDARGETPTRLFDDVNAAVPLAQHDGRFETGLCHAWIQRFDVFAKGATGRVADSSGDLCIKVFGVLLDVKVGLELLIVSESCFCGGSPNLGTYMGFRVPFFSGT